MTTPPLKVLPTVVPKHPLADCKSCPLYDDGEYVPSDGPDSATLVIVGEAPGANEAKAGKPFIGDSGQLLNTILRYYDLDRRDIFLTNATLCRAKDGATPTASAVKACRERLVSEVSSREPETVVTLGNTAAQDLLRTGVGITALRLGLGRTNEAELPGVKIIPTFHPAAALRQPDYFPSIVHDFGKIKGYASTWYEPSWKSYETEEEALACLGALEARDPLCKDIIVLDIESDIEKDVSFETPLRHKLLCVGMSYELGKVVVIGETALESDKVVEALRLYLRRRRLAGQNMKFDLKGLWARLGEALRVWFDTMLASYCLDERPRIHSLEYQGIERLGTPDWKGELDKYKSPRDGYGVIPRPVLYKYNAFDVHVTAMLMPILQAMMNEMPKPEFNGVYTPKTIAKLHDFLCAASNQLMFVELNGIAVDREYNDRLMIEYTDILERKRAAIVDAIPGYTEFNPNSPKQVKEVVKDTFRLPLPRALNSKREYVETTNADALEALYEKCVATGHIATNFFFLMLEHRKEAKLYGTYIKGIRNRMWRGRVYPTFLLHGTTTGRLSCRNPNLQNIPRGSLIRRQFIPAKENHVFIEADFGQAELRVLCWLAQDEYLREIFNDPTRDLFDELTPRLYGDVSPLTPEQMVELRIRVKAYVYGLSYGREAESIAMEYNIPATEAKRGMAEFFKVIPQTVAFREETRRKVLNGIDLVTPFGRHRRFWLITKQNRKDVLNEALAFLPQSTASDITLSAAVAARPQTKGIGWIRNLVHDSILAECPEDKVEEMCALIERCMLESARSIVGDYVKFKVDIKVGKSWGDLQKRGSLVKSS